MAVTRLKPKLTDLDEAEARAFYTSCGLSADTIERAIRARRGLPSEEKYHVATTAKANRSRRKDRK